MRNFLPLLLTLFVASPLGAQTGFVDRTVSVGGESYRYQVYVPANYAATTEWPVIVSLHGNGRQGTDGMFQTGTDFAIRIRENRAPFPSIIIFPQAKPGTRWFYPEMEDLVMAELRRTIAEFRIDTTRLYLHGYSMGGTGSYRIAFRWPTVFAAIVVVAGRVEDSPQYTPAEIEIDRQSTPFVTAPDPFATLAAGIKHIPIWIFHGDADETVRVDQSRKLVSALKLSGAPAHYTEYPGVDHNGAPSKAYAEAELFRWLLAQHR